MKVKGAPSHMSNQIAYVVNSIAIRSSEYQTCDDLLIARILTILEESYMRFL